MGQGGARTWGEGAVGRKSQNHGIHLAHKTMPHAQDGAHTTRASRGQAQQEHHEGKILEFNPHLVSAHEAPAYACVCASRSSRCAHARERVKEGEEERDTH